MQELSTILVANSMLAVLVGIVISFATEVGLEFFAVLPFQWSTNPNFLLFHLFATGIVLAIVSIGFCFIAWEGLGGFEEMNIELLAKMKDGEMSEEEVLSEYQEKASINREVRDSISSYIRVGRSLSLTSLSILLITVLLILYV